MRYDSLPKVAYFCMEFGLSPDLTIYSGGLGILAGDVIKSSGDLGVPLVGVGILWDRGYTSQTIDDAGHPIDAYPPTDRRVLEATGARVEVQVRGETVALTAHRVRFLTRGDLYLLEPVDEKHRWITRSLYGGGTDDRVAQEIVLGVGGVRLLQALGRDIDVYHFNEGHAVFAGLELIRQARERGQDFPDSVAEVRQKVVFTTHTPVPAGNETHGIEHLIGMSANVGLSASQLESIGGKPFCMTVAGLRLARKASAVAELHGETAREMWKDVSGAAPIATVTNGVHVHTWQDARIRAARAPSKVVDEQRAELRSARQQMRRELFAEVHARSGIALDPDKLTIGFARRAATYKRANLILGDPGRLSRILESGVQLVFSGKAHPADQHGRDMVSRLVAATRDFAGQIVFLENYDMRVGALMTRGCDVWLNNPRRPKEACGTSGMKAAMNGVLNCSILDGWWPEGCQHGVNGWQILPDYTGAGDEAARDLRDRDELYRVIESDIAPTWGDAERWMDMMLASIDMSSWRFSSDRMVQDYYRVLYRKD